MNKKESKCYMFSFFKLPTKKPGEVLNTADRAYLIKLIVVTGFLTVSLTVLGVQFLLERHIHRMDNSAKYLMAWSKKADLANQMLNDMFKVQQMKEDYGRQGVKATEDNL